MESEAWSYQLSATVWIGRSAVISKLANICTRSVCCGDRTYSGDRDLFPLQFECIQMRQ